VLTVSGTLFTYKLKEFKTELDEQSKYVKNNLVEKKDHDDTTKFLSSSRKLGDDVLKQITDYQQKEIVAAEHDIDVLNSNVGVLKTTVSKHGKRLDSAELNIFTLNSNVGVLKTTVSKHGNRLDTAENNIFMLNSNVSVLKSTTSNHGQRLNTAEQNISGLEQSVGSLNTSLTNTVNTLNTTRNTVSTMDKNLQGLTNSFTVMKSNLGFLSTDMKNMNSEFASIHSDMTLVKNNATTLTTKVNNMQNTFNTQYSTLQNSLNNLQNTTQTQYNTLNTSLHATQSNLSTLQSSYNATSSQVSSLLGRMTTTQDSQLSAQIQAINNSLNTTSSTVGTLTNTVNSIRSSMLTQSNISTITSQINTINQSLASVQSSLTSLTSQVNNASTAGTTSSNLTLLATQVNKSNLTLLATQVNNMNAIISATQSATQSAVNNLTNRVNTISSTMAAQSNLDILKSQLNGMGNNLTTVQNSTNTLSTSLTSLSNLVYSAIFPDGSINATKYKVSNTGEITYNTAKGVQVTSTSASNDFWTPRAMIGNLSFASTTGNYTLGVEANMLSVKFPSNSQGLTVQSDKNEKTVDISTNNTIVRNSAFFEKDANFKGARSTLNPNNLPTVLASNDNKNYLRGDTDIVGNTNNAGDLYVAKNIKVDGQLCVNDVCIDSTKLRQVLTNLNQVATPAITTFWNSISGTAKLALVALYSFKLINADYKGPVVKVRRSSDNIVADFYANPSGQLGTAVLGTGTSIQNWIGGNVGYIHTWYDQSGRGKNLQQTTQTSQPQLVLSNEIGVYLKDTKQLVTSNVFDATSISNMQIIFSMKEIKRVPNFLINLNGSNNEKRFSLHCPWSYTNHWYFDAGDVTTNRCVITSLTPVGARSIVNAYKSSSTGKCGLKVNATEVLSQGNTPADVSGGLYLNSWQTSREEGSVADHHIYSLMIFNTRIFSSDENTITSNI
jgi:septal ring factor EnvC (AmiA/AmiB activator)